MMKQKAYKKKDKKAWILKVIQSRNDRGDIIEHYRPITDKSLWCYTENLHGFITDNGLVLKNEEERLFCFNYRENIEQGDKILYKGKFYEITRMYSEADYKTELFCYAKKFIHNIEAIITDPHNEEYKIFRDYLKSIKGKVDLYG